MPADILVLKQNPIGKDYIIGDVHGSVRQLKAVITRTKLEEDPNARLIIAGDLTDKGENSLSVVESIIRFNNFSLEKIGKPQIYVARGNHEDIFLNYYFAKKACLTDTKPEWQTAKFVADLEDEFRKKMAKDKPRLSIQEISIIVEASFADYSDHLYDLFVKKNEAGAGNDPTSKAKFEENEKALQAPYEAYDVYKESLRWLMANTGQWVLNLKEEEFTKIAKFSSSLPYIIYAEGEKNMDFYVVHADLPRDHESIQAQIKEGNLNLTPIQRQYATWAREEDIYKHQITRKPEDPDTFCGHTILGGVRPESRHINLDVGTYLNTCICLVKQDNKKQKRSCKIMVNNHQSKWEQNNLGLGKTPAYVCQEINAYFKLQATSTLKRHVEEAEDAFINDLVSKSLFEVGFFKTEGEAPKQDATPDVDSGVKKKRS